MLGLETWDVLKVFSVYVVARVKRSISGPCCGGCRLDFGWWTSSVFMLELETWDVLKVDTHQYSCSAKSEMLHRWPLLWGFVVIQAWVEVISLHAGVGNLGCVEGGDPPVSM